MPGPSEQGKYPKLHPFARAGLDAVLTEPLPDRWKELLQKIHEQEGQQSSSDTSSDEVPPNEKSDE